MSYQSSSIRTRITTVLTGLVVSFVTILPAAAILVLTLAGPIFGKPGVFDGGPSPIPADQIFVTVESIDGWGKVRVAGFDLTGKFTLVGLYSDQTPVVKTLDENRCQELVNDLLDMNFFNQPEEFLPYKFELAQGDGNGFEMHPVECIDGGFQKINLHIGTKNHSVKLVSPAWGCPRQLQDWVLEFRGMVEESFGLEGF